ncbi:MAG TPA: GNAT family N-acetyltransferase [Streptosporangiaceae bacterium]|nr:GNAT family N-acetyltransferase [Streptosporangiaceae bacterium]
MNSQPAPAVGTCHVVPATPADTDTLSHVIAAAFHDLAPSLWLVTDTDDRRRVFPGYFRIYVEHALEQGIAYTNPGRTGVALWLPLGDGPPAPDPGYVTRLAAATSPWTARFQAFDTALDGHHPTGIPHHHLAILAVHPDHQAQRIGTALLDAHHAALDADGTPAYLEASGQRTRDLYLAHGYRDCGYPIELPGGPAMYPMWRRPRLPRRRPRG